MKKHNKSNNAGLLLGLGLVVIAVIGGWMYLNSQKPSLEIVTDKPAYFNSDNPQVEIKLHNAGGANSGEVTITYDNKFLKLTDKVNTAGVQIRELDNKLIFSLSEEYFKSNTNVISKLTFDNLDFGKTTFEFDKANSTLTTDGNQMNISEFKDKSIEVGVTPDRGDRKTEPAEQGSIDSI